MAKTLILVPNLGLQDFFRDIYLYYLGVVPSYHPMQFTGKLMSQTWENGKKNLISGPILAHLAQIWAPNIFFAGFPSIRC